MQKPKVFKFKIDNSFICLKSMCVDWSLWTDLNKSLTLIRRMESKAQKLTVAVIVNWLKSELPELVVVGWWIVLCHSMIKVTHRVPAQIKSSSKAGPSHFKQMITQLLKRFIRLCRPRLSWFTFLIRSVPVTAQGQVTGYLDLGPKVIGITHSFSSGWEEKELSSRAELI